MGGIDLQGVFFGSQNAGMFGCGSTSTEQVRAGNDADEEISDEVKVVVIPNDASGSDVKVVVIPGDVSRTDKHDVPIIPIFDSYSPPEIIPVDVDDLAGKEAGVKFCNLPGGLTTNVAVVPICIQRPGTEEFKYKSLDSNAPASIIVNGNPITLYPSCSNPFWGDAHLKEGENSIIGLLAYQGGEVYQVEIKVNFDPAFSTADQALVYGIRQNQIVVMDVENGWMLGEIQSGSIGLGPKNLQISPDGHFLYSPREAGIEVIDTASNAVNQTIPMDTGGYAALTPEGDKIFLNRHTKDGSESYYRTNLVDTATWEQLLSFKGGGPDYPMAVVPFTGNKLYINSSSSIYVYSPPDYTESNYISSVGGSAFAVSPMGNWAVSGSYTIHMLDVKLDQEIYSFEPSYPAYDAVFSPDGELVYLGGDSGMEAHHLAAKATFWATNPYAVKADKTAITPDGKFVYGADLNLCGTDASVVDTGNGAVVGLVPKLTLTGAMVYKPAY